MANRGSAQLSPVLFMRTGLDQSPKDEAEKECSEFHLLSSRGSLISSCLPKKGGYLRARINFFPPQKQKKPKPKTTVYSDIMKNDMSPFSMILTSPFVETMTLELLREEPVLFLRSDLYRVS